MAVVNPKMPSAPRQALPPGACDTHNHVFGPYDRFPLTSSAAFPMPLAPASLHRRMLANVGADRAVLVQPSQYGVDVSALVDALRESRDQLRGIGAARADVEDSALDAMHSAGVRGLRFVDAFGPDGALRPGAVGSDQMQMLAPRMKERGWHAQIWAGAADLFPVLAKISTLGIPLVIDHMGMLDPKAGLTDPKFQQLVDLLRDGLIWVKLSVCRVGRAPNYEDVRPFHDALIAANPNQVLWASDWPFIRLDDRAPDVGALLDLLHEWVDDPALWRQILTDNPAHLFGFTDPTPVADLDTQGMTI